jgi:micrococcal nuclease
MWIQHKASATGLDRQIAAAESREETARASYDRAVEREGWFASLKPREVPVKTAKSETGLAAISGIALYETRRKQGQSVWTQVDRGTLYITDRKAVFAGAKNVGFRFNQLRRQQPGNLGLELAVYTRKRTHILAGPVDRLVVMLGAAQAWTEDRQSALAPFRAATSVALAAVVTAEEELSSLRAERNALVVPSRPVSPAWIPGAALAIVLLLAFAMVPRQAPLDLETAASDALLVMDVAADSGTSTAAPAQASSTATTPPVPTTSSTVVSIPHLQKELPGTVAMVSSVSGGDSLTIDRPAGSEPVRLMGITAMEPGDCMSAESSDRLRQLLEGRAVILVPDETERDAHNRLLRYVWVDDQFVNETLVAEGLVLARNNEPDSVLGEVLDAAQRRAQSEHLGMWATDACGTESETSIVITHVRYDASGDDNANLNGEYLMIRNESPGPVDLSAWTLKDDSASHRYTFPVGFALLASEQVKVMTGCGVDTPTDLYWCNTDSAVWNNDGDTAFLLDPSENIHTSYPYEGTPPPTTTTRAPTTTIATTTTIAATTSTAAARNCDPSYPTVCIPPKPPDLDCGEISHRNFKVTGSDPHGFDRDNDGVGCES